MPYKNHFGFPKEHFSEAKKKKKERKKERDCLCEEHFKNLKNLFLL